MRNFKWAIPVLAVVCCAAYLLHSAYNGVRDGMIRQLQAQEMILAKQAGQGIENLFDNYWSILDTLSKSAHVIVLDEIGKEWLRTLYYNNTSSIKSITRLDSTGKVVYSYPYTSIIGVDLSGQEHVQLISNSHKTVVSDLFKSVQGFQTVVLHLPVFSDGNYDGTLGILIDYDYIAEKYLDNIKIGNDGYAFLLSQKGIELYSPIQSHVGKPASENYMNSPSFLPLLTTMEKGGDGTFHYDLIENNRAERRYAAYWPVRLYNTTWSICVTAPEEEALSHIQGFRDRWIVILLFLTVAGVGCSYYFLRFHLLKTEYNVRKETEEALRESETRFRTLFEAMAEGVALHEVVYDEQGVAVDYRIISTNPAFEKHTELSPDRVLGRPVTEIPGVRTAPHLERFARVAQSGQPDSFESTFLSENRYFHISVTSPKKGHFVTVFENITERRQAEQALRESEERYRRLFEMESDAILVVDIETGRNLDANPAAAELYGYSLEEFLAMGPMDISAEPEETMQAIQEKNCLIPLRRHRKKDGTIVPVEIRGRHSDLGGRRVHIAAIRDISDRIEAEKERKTLEDKLRQAQKLEALGTLAGGIAHDFNNLLAPIMGYSEMALLNTPDLSPMRRGLEHILNAAIRASDLVKQILAFSRLKPEENKVPLEIGLVVMEALKLLRSSLPSSIEIRQDIETGAAIADSTQMHQILMNLCTNAAQAMNDKGIIHVSLKRINLSESELAHLSSTLDLKPGPYLRLRIADTGCGMDARTMERIFDPYFTTKEVGKGSGLGLAVVHGIVKRHQGTVTVRSEPGKGATFSIYIPATEARAGSAVEVRSAAPKGTERILLIDDEQVVLEMETDILERLGYQVTPVADSGRAIQIYRAAPAGFDLIMTDYTMPHLTGGDLVAEIRRMRPDMPIVLCTGFSEKVNENTAAEIGVEFIMKPFGVREIAATVRKALAKERRAPTIN